MLQMPKNMGSPANNRDENKTPALVLMEEGKAESIINELNNLANVEKKQKDFIDSLKNNWLWGR